MDGREPVDPARLRVSDQERHAVAEVLRQAAGEGRIDLEELEERLEATYAAKTYAELVPLTADLPLATPHAVPPVPAVPAVRPASTPATTPTYAMSVAVLSETRRSGIWTVGDTHTALAFMGSVVLDLREAQVVAREVTLNAHALMASVEILVPPEMQVVVEGVGVMGEFVESRSRVAPALSPASPLVRVRGVALMGSVTVKRKERRGR